MKVLISFIVFYVSASIYFFDAEISYSLHSYQRSMAVESKEINSSDMILKEFSNFEDLAALNCEDEYDIPTRKKREHIEIQNSDIDAQFNEYATIQTPDLNIKKDKSEYWQTLYMIESRLGASLFRPRNHVKSCLNTSAPCGHHQLNAQALKDIGCKTKQCKKDRENFNKSLAMTKKLQEINQKRMRQFGYKNLPEYQQYLIHQQGAKGISTILAASEGKKLLSKHIKTNMANNSPYSYKTLRKMGSKLAAKQFMKYWEKQWQNKKIIATQHARNKSIDLPELNSSELQIALNINLSDYK